MLLILYLVWTAFSLRCSRPLFFRTKTPVFSLHRFLLNLFCVLLDSPLSCRFFASKYVTKLIFLILINSDQFFSQKIQWFSVSHISCTSKKSLKYCQLWSLISRRAHQSVVKTKQIPIQWYNHKFNFGEKSCTGTKLNFQFLKFGFQFSR